MAASRVVLGMDIGSTKIATVVGEVHNSRGLVLRGLNQVQTSAIAKGVVRDLNQAAYDINESFSGAMYSSGLVTDQVYVGITGREMVSQNRTASIKVADADGGVSVDDINLVIDKAMPRNLHEGQRIVHTMIREFALDGIRTTRSPLGMIGSRLDVETHVVLGSASQIANLERALTQVDLKVRSYVHNLIAAGETVLSAEDRNSGCVLIDFGGGTTNVGIFHGGTLCYSRCIPIGGQNYDQDLKHGLGVSFEEAQRIKKSYGKAWIDPDNEELEDFIDVKFFGRREFDKIKRRRIYEIMQPRTEELLERIELALKESGEMPRVAGGIIIVGGGCQLRQLRRYLQKNLHRQVRLGTPSGIGHLLDEYRTPTYATPLGLLVYAMKYELSPSEPEPSFLSEVWSAMLSITKGVFGRKPDDDSGSKGSTS